MSRNRRNARRQAPRNARHHMPPPARVVSMTSSASNKPPSRRQCAPGVVLLVPLPYTDVDGNVINDYKTRPAVVVEQRGDTRLLVAPITSSPNRFSSHSNVELSDLDAAGLSKACGVQNRRFWIDRKASGIRDLRGELTYEDLDRVLAQRVGTVVDADLAA